MRRFVSALLASSLLAAPALAEDFAVVIGNRSYGPGIPEVAYAHNDAAAVATVARDLWGVRDGNVVVVEDASQAEMEALFGNERSADGKLARWITPGETDLTVYYSGHGVPGQRDGRGYLLPVDADPDAAEINGYPLELLYGNLAALGARSVTVILEACFTGDSAAGPLITGASPIRIEARFPDLPQGMRVLAAAEADQLANWDDERQLGLFTYHWMSGLYGAADDNGDRQVTLSEMDDHLLETLTYDARRLRGRVQRADLLGPAGQVLSRLPDPVPELPLPRPAFGGLAADQLLGKPVEIELETVVAAPLLDRPQLGARRLGVLPSELSLTATEQVGADWFKVVRNGEELGFIHQSSVRRVSTAPPVAASTSIVSAVDQPTPAPRPAPISVTPSATEDSMELALWQAAEADGTPESYNAYLATYPNGVFAALARVRVQPEAQPVPDPAPNALPLPASKPTPPAEPDPAPEIRTFTWALIGDGPNDDNVHIWAAIKQRDLQSQLADWPVYLQESADGSQIHLRVGPMSPAEVASFCPRFTEQGEACRQFVR